MGYYTYYTLAVYDKDMKFLRKESQDHELIITKEFYSNDSEEPDLFTDQMKWYKHETDMIKHSLKYPDFIFRLQGEGESNEDWWRQYFHNGKMIGFSGEIVFGDEYVSINDFK